MSALEKFSVSPRPARHALRALPAGMPVRAAVADSFAALVRLAERLLPDAIFVVDRGESGGLRSWPSGIMGRRAPVDALVGTMPRGAAAAEESWVANVGDLPDSSELVRDGGPLALARVPLHSLAPGSFAVIRQAGEWAEEERALVRDLAEAFSRECERQDAHEGAEGRRGPHVGEGTPGVETGERVRRGRVVDPMVSIAPLLSGVCHELNNPLTSIKSFAELLLLDARSEDDREALEIVQREAHRAARIVGDLRMLARQSTEGSMLRELVELNEVVRGVIDARQRELQLEGIEITAVLATDLPAVRAVRPQLEQLVSRLLSNAIESLAASEGARRIGISTSPGENGVRLMVQDSGNGIAVEHLGATFDPFRPGHHSVEGFSLGLSLVQSIVASHGGSVAARRLLEQGTAITVELPAEASIPPDVVATDEPPAARGLRVLVVDDEAPIRYSLARYLERRGHDVHEATDGVMALRMVYEAPPRMAYDIVIADLCMPEMGGESLLERFREGRSGLEQRLILMTGNAPGNGTSPVAQELGVPVLSKPFELAEVAQIIEAQARLLLE